VKYVWEAEDIKPGVWVRAGEAQDVLIVELFSAPGGNKCYVLNLRTYIVIQHASREHLAKLLTEEGYAPVFADVLGRPK
jgi:hypothetical protein